MRTEEVAAELNVSKTVVWRQINSGRLPAKKFGRDWRILREDFEKFRTLPRERGRPRKDGPIPFRYQMAGEIMTTQRIAERPAPSPPGPSSSDGERE